MKYVKQRTRVVGYKNMLFLLFVFSNSGCVKGEQIRTMTEGHVMSRFCTTKEKPQKEWAKIASSIVVGRVRQISLNPPKVKILTHACWAKLDVIEVIKGSVPANSQRFKRQVWVKVYYDRYDRSSKDWKKYDNLENCPLEYGEVYLIFAKVGNLAAWPFNKSLFLEDYLRTAVSSEFTECYPVLKLPEIDPSNSVGNKLRRKKDRSK